MTGAPIEYDMLTGILKRSAFDKLFKEALENAAEQEWILSLGFIDIDHMKDLNDQYGHDVGDEVLKKVASSITQFAGEEAVISRYGGEEFTILFLGLEREQAFLRLERIREAMDNVLEFEAKTGKASLKATLSGGVAAYPTDGQTEAELLRRADQALYRAKATGRNKVCMSQEERMRTKTTHYTLTQLERLRRLSQEEGVGEAVFLREALDDLLIKYRVSEIES
jgi:diguanylate cyclase